MKYRLQSIDSRLQWNTFIQQTNSWAFFQTWEWGEIQSKNGRTVYRFGIFENMRLIGLLQIVKIVARRGTFLHVRHGPVLLDQDKHIWKFVRGELIALAKRESADFIRMNPMISDSKENRAIFKQLGFIPSQLHAMDAELCWVLDISPSPEVLLSQMRKTTRYEIRRALQQGVCVRISTDLKDLKYFESLYDITAQRQKFVKHDAIYEEFSVFSQSSNALLLLGEYNKQVTSAAIIVFFGDQAIYHHGASIPSKLGVSYAVQWAAINESKKRGKKLYNFWGIAPENNDKHPWRGITLFKKGFGGQERQFLHTHDLPITWKYSFVRLLELSRKWRKGY